MIRKIISMIVLFVFSACTVSTGETATNQVPTHTWSVQLSQTPLPSPSPTNTLTSTPEPTLTSEPTPIAESMPSPTPTKTPTISPTPEWPKVYTHEELLDLTSNLRCVQEGKPCIYEVINPGPEDQGLVWFESVSTGNFRQIEILDNEQGTPAATVTLAEFASQDENGNPFLVDMLLQIDASWDDYRSNYFPMLMNFIWDQKKLEGDAIGSFDIEELREILPKGFTMETLIDRRGGGKEFIGSYWVDGTNLFDEDYKEKIRRMVVEKFTDERGLIVVPQAFHWD